VEDSEYGACGPGAGSEGPPAGRQRKPAGAGGCGGGDGGRRGGALQRQRQELELELQRERERGVQRHPGARPHALAAPGARTKSSPRPSPEPAGGRRRSPWGRGPPGVGMAVSTGGGEGKPPRRGPRAVAFSLRGLRIISSPLRPPSWLAECYGVLTQVSFYSQLQQSVARATCYSQLLQSVATISCSVSCYSPSCYSQLLQSVAAVSAAVSPQGPCYTRLVTVQTPGPVTCAKSGDDQVPTVPSPRR